jgi:Uma2 family endonuclease
MKQPLKKTVQKLTYADYLTWADNERWELIDGVAYDMSPAPGRRHQEISGELFRQLANHLKGKQCKVYDAPFDVRFSDQADASDNYIETVVQPDILVVCDRTKLDEKGCNGAPDLIIEITSPSTAKHDLGTKFDLYQKHAVQEYWIIHPSEQTMMVFKLRQDGYYGVPELYAGDDKVTVPLLGELYVDLGAVFME